MSTAEKINLTTVEDLFQPYEVFCRSMLDAYVVIDDLGRIVRFNQLMCQITGMKTKQLQKAESIEDVIEFYINGAKLKTSDLIAPATPTRFDEVRGSIPGNDGLNLILGIYPFKGEKGIALGAFILIRDVTAETKLQGKYKDVANKSISDALTGLLTRAYFEDFLRLQTKALLDLPIKSEQRSISIVMIDIDFFKKVNDVHGHQAGDYILKSVATLMRKSFRATDTVCRYGGEEFLAILPATDLKGAALAAEKLRQNVEQEVIIFDGTHIPVTVSIGVAQINLGAETYIETIHRADQSLYEAKRKGRNRVITAD